jgi:hypothetical protein
MKEAEMTRLIRIGMAVAAGAAAGVAAYALVKSLRSGEALVQPDVESGKLIRFPAERPPFAEAAHGDEGEEAVG